MEFFKKKTDFDFMGIRKWTALVSIILIGISIAFLAVRGLNMGLDFTGGYQIQVNYTQTPSTTDVTNRLKGAGLSGAQVTTFGSSDSLMIKLPVEQKGKNQGAINQDGESVQQALKAEVSKALGTQATVASLNYIGPQVGKELATNGLLALIVAMICIVGYIAFRFEMKFALSAGIALIHDPIVILGVFSAFQLEFNLITLAAVLAVIGFSLNDTVVIYDRVRENFRKMRKASVIEVINRSVNDTLSRTIMTSGLTLLVVVVLFFFGGPSLHEFSLALILGVIIGTYSSIYVAGVLAVLFGLKRESLLPTAKIEDGRP
ncbi:protein translocase subunit SecF [Fangia hongkongensis]|uniref:protein translocase subunit SecF n=1 Tax=Fangia hongkongensis TaxID=270495 RepID=UPI00037C1C00|nr:protein translocase subunit SecF [Fangia hongkongensis]MBK2123918.1 protein translocase subunit SecF [Fangia hongkongensis]